MYQINNKTIIGVFCIFSFFVGVEYYFAFTESKGMIKKCMFCYLDYESSIFVLFSFPIVNTFVLIYLMIRKFSNWSHREYTFMYLLFFAVVFSNSFVIASDHFSWSKRMVERRSSRESTVCFISFFFF